MRLALRWPRWLFGRRSAPPPAPKPEPVKPAPTTPVPKPVDAHNGNSTFEPAKPLRVNLGEVNGFSTAERQKLDQAVAIVEKVLNSPEFKKAVLEKTWKGERQFADNGGMTNEQIYEAILQAKENFTAEADGEVDLELTIKKFGFFQRNVVGYTYESTPEITLNRSFFTSYTPAEIAGNLVHEWLHKIGFGHDFKSTAKRPDSVPYAIGELVEKLGAQV